MGFLISICFLGNINTVKSQNGYVIRKLKTSDESSISNIRKIAQDKYGFIWFASQDGLYRYNSKSFAQYNIKGTGKNIIGGSDVRDILIDDTHDNVWVCTSYGGINKINLITNKVEYHISQDYFGNDLLKALYIDQRILYIITTRSIYRFNTTNNETNLLCNIALDKTDFVKYFLPVSNKSFVLYTKDNRILLYNFDNPKLQYSITCPDGRIINQGFGISKLKSNQIIVTTTRGIFFYSTSNNIIKPAEYKEFGNFIGKQNSLTAIVDKDNTLWIATTNGIWKENKGRLAEVRVANNLFTDKGFLNTCYQMFCDADNNIWLGTQNEPYFLKNSFAPFHSIQISDDKKTIIKHAYFLLPVSDSVLYACAEEGLYKINTYTKKIEQINGGVSYDYIFRDDDNDIIVSNKNGLFYLKNNIEIPLYKKYKELKKIWPLNINSHVVVNDTITLLASENKKGIVIWNRKSNNIKLLDQVSVPSLPDININKITSFSKNTCFILSDENICIYDVIKNEISKIRLPGNGFSIFFDIALYKGYYYLASYGKGILKLDKDFNLYKTLSVSDGLSNNGVYKLLTWEDSILFITTNNGLNIYNDADGRVKKYFKSDGLHGNIFEETSGNILNGKLYTGGVDGITIINPLYLQTNIKKPSVYFGNIKVEFPDNKQLDTFNISSKKLSIPSNWLQTTIEFGGINYSNTERTTFSYRLLEQSYEWINLNIENSITLVGLSPGNYHLQIKAANEDGIWSEPKELILVFLPKWYQTWWFKLMIFLTTAVIIYAFYRYRINQIKKQHEIRKNIATDLHDDLGSTLNSVKVFTNLAISGIKQEESLQQVKDNLTEATISLRDMIWVLDDSLDTVDELITRLKQFAIPVTAASNIDAIIKADSEVNTRQLTKEEKRNLFLICKEAINNSIKYSGASQINVIITASGKKIQIVVVDNGKGFNVAEVMKGYGLKNMQYRAGQIKYKVIVNSLHGTEIIVLPT